MEKYVTRLDLANQVDMENYRRLVVACSILVDNRCLLLLKGYTELGTFKVYSFQPKHVLLPY